MKNFIFTATFLVLLSNIAHAAPISIGNIDDIYVANTLLGSSNSAACEADPTRANCDFVKTNPIVGLNNSALEAIVTSDPATYVVSPDKPKSSFRLGFDGFDLFTGEGNDLVVFIVGNATSFGLDVFDTEGNNIDSGIHTVATPTFALDGSVLDSGDTVFNSAGEWFCVSGTDNICTGGAALSALFFDIGDDGTEIGSIRISLGEQFNIDGERPRFSLAGGFHNESITAVPLPLSAVLFGSGLSLLGWVGRRKAR